MSEFSRRQHNFPPGGSIPESAVSLESILCTEELRLRPSRPPDYEKENRALVLLAGALADSRANILQTLAETILEVTQCDSSGLSLLTTHDGGERFYWPAIAGVWKPHVGHATPRNFSACGDVLDRNCTLLFRRFERRYSYLLPVIPWAEECLMVPFYVGGKAVGTIWAIMHTDRRKFDREDERLLGTFGQFASLASQTAASSDDLKVQITAREKAETALRELAKRWEVKIRRLVEANIIGIFFWDLEGKIDEANEAFLTMVQYGRNDLGLGNVRWTDLTPVEWRARDELAKVNLKATGAVEPYEKEFFRKDGSRVPVLIGAALFGEGGNEGVAFVFDLSEQKRAEETVRRVEQQARSIVDSALDAVVAMSADGIITDWNKQAEEIFGWTRPEALGRRMSETIIPLQYRVSHERGLRDFFKTGRGPVLNRRIEITAFRRDGSEFPVELTVTPLKSGDSWTFSSFIRDISERKQAEEMRTTQARQIAVRADISIAFGKEGSWKTILGECAESIVRHLDAAFARIWTLSGDGKVLELQASAGMYTHLDGAHGRVPMGKLKIGLIAQERKPHLTNDVLNDPRIGDREWAKKEGMVSFAGHPLIVGDRTLGVLAMFSRKPITAGTAEALASVADLIAQGIERKIAEDRLRDSECSLRQLTETIPEMLWSAEVDGAINYCNQRVLHYTGLPAEQAHGASWMQAVHPDDIEKMAQAWTHAVSTGEPFQFQFRCLRASDGMYRWCVSSALPLRASDGSILKWYGTVVDFHDRRQAQEDLRNTQAELAHVNRVMTMGELTASIAHEVSQPLAAIVASGDSCTAWLASEPPNLDKARASASRMIQAATQASEIVQRVRSLFKKTPSVTASVDMNELIEETISFVRGEAQRKNVSLRTELGGVLPTVSGDRVQLEQVILNLMMNGIESMAGLDSEPKRLLIRSALQNPDELLVSVADTGPGIDAQDSGRLFAPFFTTKKEGIGMGLPISRSIVEAHGGRLWAAKNESRGAVFHFILPVKTPSE